jgi:hypothetical protein
MSNKRKPDILKFYLTSKKRLSIKYNSFENSYSLICINNLIYTENCHIVARFKDFLYYDDDTEFINKFFYKNELKKILKKVFNFYSKYCKVFPNYMILPENEFLYRNLRKKQKLIDQFNEIKKEEEENRKHLNLKKNKNNENKYIIFGKKEQESIDKYKPSFTQSTIMMDYLNFYNSNSNEKSRLKISYDLNDSKNTISLNYNNKENMDLNDINTSELTLISITNLINKSPTKTEKTSGKNQSSNKLSFTPHKSKTKTEKFNIVEDKSGNNLNDDIKKKYISYYQSKKDRNTKQLNNNIKVNHENNTNYNSNSNTNNKLNNNKKENLTVKKNNIVNNNIMMSANNSSQTKNSTNILISSITKTSKGKDSKNASKNIKTTITKKKLFTTTEKPISHKKPIYNYQMKKGEKNSNSINNNKHKKNMKDMITISFKPSISPPVTKINSLKLKIMGNIMRIQSGNKNNVKSPSNNNSNSLSYVTKNNKNIKFNQTNNININNLEKTENEKINVNIDKKVIKINPTIKKISTKETIQNYKNILKMDKTNHFSHDINKNHIIMNKNIFTNLTDKLSYKNTSNDKIRKTEQNNKYISPATKKNISINNKNIKTPNKPEMKHNEIKKIILNTKDGPQYKMQNYIKKILDKNNTKKEFVINKSKIK